MQNIRRPSEMAGDDVKKRNAFWYGFRSTPPMLQTNIFSLYIDERKRFIRGQVCSAPNSTCKPIFKWSMEVCVALLANRQATDFTGRCWQLPSPYLLRAPSLPARPLFSKSKVPTQYRLSSTRGVF